MSRKTVGILGGMGPLATLAFLQLLISQTPATRDWEHLRIVTDINPQIPSRSRHHLYGEASPVPGMTAACLRLAAYPVDFIVVPCNSAAAFLAEVAAAVPVPIENIVDVTAHELSRLPMVPRRVAVLGGVVTHERALYRAPLQSRGIEYLHHEDDLQRRTEHLIERLKLAGGSEVASMQYHEIADQLKLRYGVDGLVLGCTELTMLDTSGSGLTVVDSSAALARHAVRLATGGELGD